MTDLQDQLRKVIASEKNVTSTEVTSTTAFSNESSVSKHAKSINENLPT